MNTKETLSEIYHDLTMKQKEIKNTDSSPDGVITPSGVITGLTIAIATIRDYLYDKNKEETTEKITEEEIQNYISNCEKKKSNQKTYIIKTYYSFSPMKITILEETETSILYKNEDNNQEIRVSKKYWNEKVEILEEIN